MQVPTDSPGFSRRDFAGVIVLIPMFISALVIGAVLFAIDWFARWPWYTWVILLPAIYFAWLLLFLKICARSSRSLAKNPKPRFAKVNLETDVDETFAAVTICMYRFGFNRMFPFVRFLEWLPTFRNLVFTSYSPSVHIARSALVWGAISDPDLTEIGEDALIGWSAEVIAHAFNPRPDGTLAYVSAPIKIGARATIGGSAYVSLGCVIGEGAVVEAKSYVEAFTVIPPGETWSGVPARCVRKANEASRPSTVSVSVLQASELDQARRLVIFALNLKESEIPERISADSCKAWDSLGQVAIATAIFDRHEVAVPNNRVFRLRTLEDVANAIANRNVPDVSPSSDGEPEIPNDVDMLPLCDPVGATRALTERYMDHPAASPLRVSIASSFTTQPLVPTLKVWGRAFGFELNCELAGFGQIATALLSTDSPIAAQNAGINVVLMDPTDRVFDSVAQASSGIEAVLDAIEGAVSRQASGSQMLVGTLPPLVSSFASLTRTEYEPLRERWRSRLEKMKDVQLFDFAAVVERIGTTKARSSGGEALSRMPYSPELCQALAIALVRQILSTRRAKAKVIAVDCDNTLWGGVVGELGLNEITLGADGPGRSFQLFQQYLKRLRDRGLLLVIVSRNEESDVRSVFEKHPEMVLSLDDVAAMRVNWKHKSENLTELAKELNLGLDSFVFLDDDPAIRMEVSLRLPEVHVVPLPEDPARYCETLERLWLFNGAQTTEADIQRTRMVHEESRRQEERKTAASLESYLAGLQMKVEIREPHENELPRVAQLTQRTNQFNLSLKRRTLEEVNALAGDSSVLIVKARDRFGDYGLVGVCAIRNGKVDSCEIDTLLMSCRVLGRGVEEAFLHAIARTAAEKGATSVVAPFVPGPRNQVIKDFLERVGFSEFKPDVWKIAVDKMPTLPSHVECRVDD
jgi:FkbH-like protein